MLPIINWANIMYKLASTRGFDKAECLLALMLFNSASSSFPHHTINIV